MGVPRLLESRNRVDGLYRNFAGSVFIGCGERGDEKKLITGDQVEDLFPSTIHTIL